MPDLVNVICYQNTDVAVEAPLSNKITRHVQDKITIDHGALCNVREIKWSDVVSIHLLQLFRRKCSNTLHTFARACKEYTESVKTP